MAGSKTNQLQSRIKEFVEKLAEQTEEMKSSAPLLDYLRFAGTFHAYSLHNTMLIFSQRPDATRVAGYRAWQKLGRQVKKGSKAIWILAPIVSRVREDDDDKQTEQVVTRFRSVAVFDVNQTEGDPLPQAPVLTNGACNDDLIRAAVFFADAEGIQVEFRPLPGDTYGSSRGGQVIVDESLSGADQFSVLLHELAHEALHRGKDAPRLNHQTREIEAETTAYVVCQRFGVETTAPAYLALHGADPKEITARLGRLVGVVQRLIGGIEAHLTQLTNQAVNS